jgi:hypothetical protein
MDFVIRSAAVGVIILTLLSYFFLNEDSVGLSYYIFCIFIISMAALIFIFPAASVLVVLFFILIGFLGVIIYGY